MLFFFNDTATTEIYTLSLHDALPIYARDVRAAHLGSVGLATTRPAFLLLVQLGLVLLYPLLEAGSRLVVLGAHGRFLPACESGYLLLDPLDVNRWHRRTP